MQETTKHVGGKGEGAGSGPQTTPTLPTKPIQWRKAEPRQLFCDGDQILVAREEIERLTKERTLLAAGIAKLAIAAGIIQDQNLAGPQLLCLVDDLAAEIERLKAGAETAGERVGQSVCLACGSPNVYMDWCEKCDSAPTPATADPPAPVRCEASPTPTPWRWEGNDLWHVGTSYEGPDPHRYTGITADKRLADSPVLDANKELIARACNAHDGLLAACKRTLKILDAWGPERRGDTLERLHERLVKAIAAADRPEQQARLRSMNEQQPQTKGN